MKKLFSIATSFVLILSSLVPPPVYADSVCPNFTYSPNPYVQRTGRITFTNDIANIVKLGLGTTSDKYHFWIQGWEPGTNITLISPAGNIVTETKDLESWGRTTTPGTYTVIFYKNGATNKPLCTNNFTITAAPSLQCTIKANKSLVKVGEPIQIDVTSNSPTDNTLVITEQSAAGAAIGMVSPVQSNTFGLNGSFTFEPNKLGSYEAVVKHKSLNPLGDVCSRTIDLTAQDENSAGNSKQSVSKICSSIQDPKMNEDCVQCFTHGAWTAIGCIDTAGNGSSNFVTILLRLGTGMAGGIAFLLILWGGFQMITSTGNPEALNSAQELIGAAIGGLLMIIFSVFLLRLIGMDILAIPGFGK